MAPFDRSYMIFYWSAIVCCTVFRLFDVESGHILVDFYRWDKWVQPIPFPSSPLPFPTHLLPLSFPTPLPLPNPLPTSFSSPPSNIPSPPPNPPLPLEVGPRNPARGSGERCKLPQRGLGRSPSRNRIWCILA